MRANLSATTRGVTLVETMIAASIFAIMLAAIAFGAVSLQRTFTRAGDGFRASADQMLVADYLSSDLRSAVGATVTGNGQTLTVTLPDYLHPASRTPRTPTVTAGVSTFGKVNGTVDYGNPAAAPTVTYGVSNGRLVRTAGNSTSVLSKTLESFQLSVTDRAVAADFSVRFTSKFARQISSQPYVTVSDSVTFRNKQRH